MRAYIDIETTGFSASNNVPTVVGILVEDVFKQFILGIDLTGANIDRFFIEHNVKIVVGYNIKKFDVPFLKTCTYTKCKVFDNLEIDDIMITCHSHMINGGLKETERILGIVREFEPLNYYQQMALWQKWKQEADVVSLTRYLRYNEDDVRNLKLVEKKLPEYLKKRFEHNQRMIEAMKKGKI